MDEQLPRAHAEVGPSSAILYHNSIQRANINSHFNSPEFSDFTIETANKTFHVHRVVVCIQSQFLKSMLCKDWKVSYYIAR